MLNKIKNYVKLSKSGVVPLQLPKRPDSENSVSRKMALLLAEYEIENALRLFWSLFKAEVSQPGNSTEAQSAAMALFVLFISNYYSRRPISIPSPTSPRLMTLEPALVRQAIEKRVVFEFLKSLQFGVNFAKFFGKKAK